MRIKIKENGKTIRILFPTWLILNSLGLKIAKKVIKESGVNLDGLNGAKIKKIRKTIAQARKNHKNWRLVEVRDSEGTVVEVKL